MAEPWTLTGQPFDELLVGDVFTDGSCFMPGPPTWNTTGWAVVKISREGILLGWMRGTVGAQLPQSSPAAESVAVLAVDMRAQDAATANSDYQGHAGLEEQPMDAITCRKAIYAGVRMEARARSRRV